MKLKLTFFFLIFFQVSNCFSNTIKNDSISLTYKEVRGVIVIPVFINQKEYQFVFDTGAEFSVIRSSILTDGDYVEKEEVETIDANQNLKKVSLVELNDIEIIQKKTKLNTIILEDSFFDNLIQCGKIDGILGYDFIKQYNWRISPETKTLTIDNLERKGTGEITLKIKDFKGRKVVVKSKVLGAKTVFKVDTGSNASFTINKYLFNFLKDKKKMPNTNYLYGYLNNTLYGKSKGVLNTFKGDVKLDKLELKNVNVINSKKSNNLLGNGFFRNYTTYLDFKNKKIYLTKIKNKELFDFKVRILFDKEKQGLIIVSIWNPNDVEKEMIGAKILKINGVDVLNLSMDELCGLQNSYRNQENLTITIEVNEEEETFSYHHIDKLD